MIYVECTADEALVRGLVAAREDVRHELKGKAGVLARLERVNGAVGTVDADPNKARPSLLRYYAPRQAAKLNPLALRLLVHKRNGNRLILLIPELEPWLIEAAQQAGLHMDDFGLSSDPSLLHDEINQRISNLQRLIERLLEAHSPRLQELQRLLT